MIGPVLVTGAQGFLGRYVVAELLNKGADVVGVGRSTRNGRCFSHQITGVGGPIMAPLPDTLSEALRSANYEYECCDLVQREATYRLVKRLRPSKIIHLAASLRDDPVDLLFEANVTATFNLCHAANAITPSPDFVLGSTGSVYGAQVNFPVSEEARPDPIGFYAASKYMSEIVARALGDDCAIPLCIVRIFNVVGPGLQPRHLAALVAHGIAEAEAELRPARLRLGDLSTIRDFIDVRDTAKLIVNLPSVGRGLYNAGTGEGLRSGDIVRRLIEMARIPIDLAYSIDRSRPGSDKIYADMSKSRGNFMPDFTIDQSLRDMLTYARDALKNVTPDSVDAAHP
jgi:GDP-4-dehydro-6-deoxy-D-mannose reductase